MSWKHLVVMTRYPVEFATSFVTMFLILAMFGLAVLMFLPPGQAEGGATTGIIAYGFVVFLLTTDAVWAIGINLRREQVEGTLEALYLTPASKFAHLLSSASAFLVWDGLLAGATVLALGALLGRIPFHAPGLGLILMLCVVGTGVGIGLVFGAYALVAREAADSTANFVQFGLIMLCAMFFPFAVLPPPLLFLARLIPLSYTVDLFRSTMIGQAPELAPAALEWPIVVAGGLLLPWLGYALYRRAEHHVRVHGTLAEY
jgi:ABC-2 type transport system permease protein